MQPGNTVQDGSDICGNPKNNLDPIHRKMPKTTVVKWVQLHTRPPGGTRQEITTLVIVASSLIINSREIILMNKEETAGDGDGGGG